MNTAITTEDKVKEAIKELRELLRDPRYASASIRVEGASASELKKLAADWSVKICHEGHRQSWLMLQIFNPTHGSNGIVCVYGEKVLSVISQNQQN